MSEIADDHQSIIAEQLADGFYYLPASPRNKKRELNNVDWQAYFERSRKSCEASIKARAAKRQDGE